MGLQNGERKSPPTPEEQTRLGSLIESCCNVGSGFIIAVLIWEYVICPWKGIERNFWDGIEITLVFTVVSITRGYIWRRLFTRHIFTKLKMKAGKAWAYVVSLV